MINYIIYWVLIATLLLPACAANMQWSKPGATDAEFKKDCYECERDAAMLPGSPAPYRPALYANTPSGSMQSSGDDLLALSHKLGQEAKRLSLFQQCMESKGYVLINK
jgi:hypothetical protein